MWKKAFVVAGRALQPWRKVACRCSTSISSAVDSILIRSLKEHYLEVSKMTPPPKVSPPSSFSVVKGALENNGPVLRRTYGDEEIIIYVTPMVYTVPGGDDNHEVDIHQLLLHVTISKPCQKDSLHFLCGLYPDALGIHSVSLRPKLPSSGFVVDPANYNGPCYEDLDERMRDALHKYIEERGVDESLFPFLQAWLYVKENQDLLKWFKTLGTFINGGNPAK